MNGFFCVIRKLSARSNVSGRDHVRPAPGFTFIEMLVAIVLLSITMAITFGTFMAVVKAWERGTQLAENLGHGEFAMEQISSGLRSAFFPASAPDFNYYGFLLETHGYDDDALDTISWVKTGPALLSPGNPLQTGPHRIMLSIEYDEDNIPGLASRAWRPIPTETFFDPMDIEPFFISGRVIGFNCGVATNITDEGWEWENEWIDKATNQLPAAVKISLIMEPLEKGDDPVRLKRLVEIPAAELSRLPFRVRNSAGSGRRTERPERKADPHAQPQQQPGQTGPVESPGAGD